MKNIIFVDDEIQILKTLGRIFIDSGYQVFLVESAEAALKILREHPADMVVTDMRMPGMDGIELLKIIRQKYPNTVRIILSGYTDGSEIVHTLKCNLARAYIFKPWDNDELVRVIKQNLEDNDPKLPKEIISYINNLEQLPAINKRYQSILEAIRLDKDVAAISAEIEKDQIVTAKVLQVVNSAYYGIKTGSVKKALSFLGIKDLQDLALSMEIINCISAKNTLCKVTERIWNHAYITNKLQHLIQHSFLKAKSNHFDTTAGLLHKLGIIFMIKYYAKEYLELHEKAITGSGLYLYQMEREKYGFDHSDLSEYLLKWWNAPAQIVEAAAHYTSPNEEGIENKDLVHIIHIAQHYACELTNDAQYCALQPEAFVQLGIDKTAFEEQYKSLLGLK